MASLRSCSCITFSTYTATCATVAVASVVVVSIVSGVTEECPCPSPVSGNISKHRGKQLITCTKMTSIDTKRHYQYDFTLVYVKEYTVSKWKIVLIESVQYVLASCDISKSRRQKVSKTFYNTSSLSYVSWLCFVVYALIFFITPKQHNTNRPITTYPPRPLPDRHQS